MSKPKIGRAVTKAKKKAARMPAPAQPVPKSMVIIREREDLHYYKSYTAMSTTINKLKNKSSLPSHFFYTLRREGSATHELPTGGQLLIEVCAFSEEREKQLDEEAKKEEEEKSE